MKNIKEIMGQMRETPSPRCWESIANQLPTVGTAIGASSTASKASASTGKIVATAGKTALSTGKIAAIIATSTAIVTTATIITVSQLNSDTAPSNNISSESPINNTNLVATDTTTTEEWKDQVEETAITPSEQISKANYTQQKETTSAKTQTSNSASQPNTTTATSTISQYSSTPNTNSVPSASTPNPSQISSSQCTRQNTQTTSPDKNQTTATPQTSQIKPQTDEKNSEKEKYNKSYSEDENFVPAVKIEIPNIFTPNGDGVNDLFIINGIEHCNKRTLIVKDKSGQTVFQSKYYENNWDGGNLSDGQYYYFFNYSINNIEELRRGTLYIRR